MKVIWVSVSGSDSSGTGSRDLPYQTISRGLDDFVSGDQIRLMDGTYTPTDSVMVSGMDGSIFAENPDSVFIQPQKTTLHQACLAILDANRFILQGLTILQAANNAGNNIGIYVENVENLICYTCSVNNFEIPSGNGYGIYASGGGRVENCRVSNFTFSGDTLYCIRTDGLDVIDPDIAEVSGGPGTFLYGVYCNGLKD